MKNIKYLFAMLIAMTTVVSCVEDPIMEDTAPPVVGSVLKLNEIMSKDVNDGPDWIEVYNSGDEDMDISGYILNDKDVADGGFAIPAGTILKSHGFYVVDENESGIKVSSGGEDVSLSKPDKTVIDHTKTPDMSNDVGLTWAREIDGEGDWMISSPTKGSSNGTVENTPPILSADPLTEFTDVYEVTASDADGIASVKLVYLLNGGVESIDMALVDGKYKTSVPKGETGDYVEYYVVATDNTGLSSYYPESAPDELNSFYFTGGSPLFVDVVIEGIVPGYTEDLVFNVNLEDTYGIEEVKLYYIFPGETADDKESIAVSDPDDDGIYKITIPSADIDGKQIRYYLRAENVKGERTYYPIEDENFDHDDASTWPIVYEPVTTTTITYTDGPMTSITFPQNPVPGTDINIEIAYSSTDVIAEARIYFDVGENPVYDKKNKIKGEDDASFTQTGVTINLKGVEAENGMVISDSGNKTTFYVRIATEDASGNAIAEYYYGSDGKMYLDDTPGGGTTDESDAFKGDTSLWNVLKVQ